MMLNDLADPCPISGFDSRLYDEADAFTSQEFIPHLLPAAIEGLSEEQLDVVDAATGRSIRAVHDATEAAFLDLSADGAALDAVHVGLYGVAVMGAQRHRVESPPVETGEVVGLFASDGGVPKTAIPRADIRATGVEGDRQDNRRHHGRPAQALCLFSAHVIATLQAEGHPIEPGLAGENITVDGITWSALRPGSLLTVGDIPVFITAYAIPCAKNAGWFADRDFNRILHTRYPGFSRLYGIPLAEGTLEAGAAVTTARS